MGDRLQEAQDWCGDRGIEFDAVNENLQETIDSYGSDPRKISADYFIDDRAVSVESILRREEITTEQDRKKRQLRSMHTQFRAGTEGEDKFIEGYFAVFGSDYEMWPGATESVDPAAFNGALLDDIRCLIDHETRLVLGRTKAKTLELRVDAQGLWGRVKINPDDQDAMNLYARVQRGDVDQCSFGFDILDEETTFGDDGSVHWLIKSVKLYEVSVVTFPAYEDTAVAARKKDYEQIKKRRLDQWREEKKGVLAKWHSDN